MPLAHRTAHRRTVSPVPVVAVATALLLASTAGCATRVSVPVAPYAADPLCAAVVLALPQDLAGLPRLRTTSQATVAWGEATSAVVLRCGVEPPPPTTDQCVTADDGTTAVDWVAVPGPADADGAAPWTFTTYGRSPAVEVRVPAAVTSTRSTSFLLELGPAIATVEATRRCL
ncbi:DUF3515 family protein [Actinotalea sp.]|uniref:DUF3515 family protein n=1 Tax=Actinotalea sp. TaxID=1872145 RepID=UPI002C5AF4F8|nr:DUF3515 family protein [Actinotalea sp.]HQY33778.1 DUF3515 family protein [Actinotalea sp.]HRA49587.1 DUF3515 family protein [Actinotalea sp.]